MAHVLLVADSTAHVTVTRTEAALESQGHTVAPVAESDLATVDLTGVDVIAGVRFNVLGAHTQWFADRWAEGYPLLVGRENWTTSRGLTEEIGVISSLSSLSAGTNDRLMDVKAVAHPVTAGFAGATALAVTVADCGIAYYYDVLNHAGTTLGDVPSRSRSYLLAVDAGDAIDASAPSAPGSTAPARLVFAGWMYADNSDYTADGKAILGQAVDWLAEVADPSLSLGGTEQRATGSFAAGARTPASLAGTEQRNTGAFTLDVDVPSQIAFAGTEQRDTGAFTTLADGRVSLGGTEQRNTGTFTADVSKTLELAGAQQRETAAFTVAPTPTTARNRVGGRRRTGIGVAHYNPPVVEPTNPAAVAHVYEVAHAFGPVTIDGAQPTFTVTEASVARDRDRIVVGGKDVTYFRDVPTPTPDFSLIQPLLYGSGALTFPQIAAAFEQPGAGDLRWLRKGSPVKVQRVRAGVVVATDYEGFVADWTVSGGNLTVQLGGQASGRAALLNKQIPIFPHTRDAGRHGFRAIRTLRLPFKPFLGPDIGIDLDDMGGMSHLDWISQLLARTIRKNGTQYTIAPDDDGVYRMTAKDRTTIDATAYFDDARLRPDLRSDMAEEPNRIYATGITPGGRKVKFGHYPGLRQGDPPDWPLAADASFGEGDTGDHVRAAMWRLITVGYLPAVDVLGGYDADVTDAVEDLQEDAGLTITGRIDRSTWRALYDLDVTGYSLLRSRIHPAAQASKVRRWNYTPTGSISTRNANYDPTVLPVDRDLNMGTGFTRQQIRKFARAEIKESATDNWVGTVELNMAVIRGQHNPGDSLADADVMQPRELRPGMNLWAPQFMGGTLFHVSGVEVRDGGRAVRLSLDTRARDTMKAWEVITRNRESRQDPARAWINQYRSSTIDKDAFTTFDEIGGVLNDGVKVNANGWTVVPVVAGKEGTISRLRIRLDEPHEFAVAVFGRKVSEQWLDRQVPAPLAKTRNDLGGTGAPWYEQEHLRDRLEGKFILYAAGTHDEPCGLGRARKLDGNGNPTAAPVTGVFRDDATFSYRTFREPVLYLAVWVGAACHLEAGRAMWNQLEEGS